MLDNLIEELEKLDRKLTTEEYDRVIDTMSNVRLIDITASEEVITKVWNLTFEIVIKDLSK